MENASEENEGVGKTRHIYKFTLLSSFTAFTYA